MTAYSILDEPTPGAAARVAVSPLWPVLALLFDGAWLAWPWLALNAFALGVPRRARHLFACVAALAATVAVTHLGQNAGLDPDLTSVAALGLELPVAWLLYRAQRDSARVFALGGLRPGNGFWPVLFGALLRVPLLHHVDALWARALS
jgi:hypothetical protein